MEQSRSSQRGALQNLWSLFLKLDHFPSIFRLETKSFTIAGAILSIMTLIIVSNYALYQIKNFVEMSDAQLILSQEENFYRETDVFSASQGLAIAIAFIDANGDPIDERYGELAFYRNTWGFDDNGKYVESYNKIPSHTCTDQEFGLDNGDNPSFFSMSDLQSQEIKSYRAYYQCIDKQDSELNGNFNSDHG